MQVQGHELSVCASSRTLACLKLGSVYAGFTGSAVGDACFHSCFQWRLAVAGYLGDTNSNADNNNSNNDNSHNNFSGSISRHTNVSDSSKSFQNNNDGHVITKHNNNGVNNNASTLENNITLTTTTTPKTIQIILSISCSNDSIPPFFQCMHAGATAMGALQMR